MATDFQQSWLKEVKTFLFNIYTRENTLKEITLSGGFTPIDDDVNRRKLQGNLL